MSDISLIDMHLIFSIQSVSLPARNHFRLTIDMVTKMLDEEQDEEDEEAMLCLDSESEISEAEDLESRSQTCSTGSSWSWGWVLESSSAAWRKLLWWHWKWVLYVKGAFSEMEEEAIKE